MTGHRMKIIRRPSSFLLIPVGSPGRDLPLRHGVWANKPVPLYPYPGSPDYTKRWGQPDNQAWERALDYYLELYDQFSDIQDQRPLPLQALELPLPVRR